MRRQGAFNFFPALFLLLFAGGAAAQDAGSNFIQQKRMAFSCLRESGLTRDEAETFSMYLQIALTDATQWEVLDFSVTKSLILERGGTESCPNLQCEIINGQLLSVDYMCFGSIETIGQTYSLNVQIADVASGRLVANVSKFFKGKEKVFISKTIPMVARMAASSILGKKVTTNRTAKPSAESFENKIEEQSQRSFGDVRGYLAYGNSTDSANKNADGGSSNGSGSGSAGARRGSASTNSEIETTGKLAFGYLVTGRHMLPDDALRYSYQLQSYLADVGACAMLYIDEMERLMQMRGGNLQCGTERCAMNVGRLLGVDFMGYGTIRKRAGRFIIQTHIINVEDGSVITSVERRFRGREIVFLTEVIPQIAYKLGEVLERSGVNR